MISLPDVGVNLISLPDLGVNYYFTLLPIGIRSMPGWPYLADDIDLRQGPRDTLSQLIRCGQRHGVVDHVLAVAGLVHVMQRSHVVSQRVFSRPICTVITCKSWARVCHPGKLVGLIGTLDPPRLKRPTQGVTTLTRGVLPGPTSQQADKVPMALCRIVGHLPWRPAHLNIRTLHAANGPEHLRC